MKLVTIPLTQSLIMIKHQIFVSKCLPVQTPRNKHQQRTCDLFKLINRDTRVIINILFQRCCYHFSASGCFYCLFHMINSVTYIDTKIQNTALHLFELLSRQLLGNFPKITNQTSDICLKSARLKNQQRKPRCKTLANMIFLFCFNNFSKTWGWRGGLLYFIRKLCK